MVINKKDPKMKMECKQDHEEMDKMHNPCSIFTTVPHLQEEEVQAIKRNKKIKIYLLNRMKILFIFPLYNQ